MLILFSLLSAVNIIALRVANSDNVHSDYKGSQVWRITFDDDVQRQYYDSIDYQFDEWLETKYMVDVLVPSSDMDTIDKSLLKRNITKKVLINDVQLYLENENNDQALTYLRFGDKFNYHAYHGYESMIEHLKLLESRCRSMCKLIEFGRTYEKRPLYALKISPNLGVASRKSVVIDGSIHAREWIASASVMRIAEYLVQTLTQPNGTALSFIKSQDWFIIPLLNPDGYEYSRRNPDTRLWRKNRKVLQNGSGFRCIGVDLNRNFGYKWGGKGTSNQCASTTYGGENGFSEPESQALKGLIENIWNVHTYLSFHSYGGMILHPWGYNNGISTNMKYLSKIARTASEGIYKVDGRRFKYGPSADVLYPAAGGSDDWAFSLKNCVCAYTVELRGDNYGFLLPSSQIDIASQEALVAALSISNECNKIDN